jgi:hypothetical protein
MIGGFFDKKNPNRVVMDIVEDKEAKMLFVAIVEGGMKIAKSEIEVY